ncbi:hypothetical protein BH11ACT3_BH11ACT3_02860 [soil metagenome]
MGIRSSAAAAASIAIALTLLISGCAPSSPTETTGPGESPDPTPTSTPPAEPEAPPALVLSVDGISLEDGDGNEVASAPRDAPDQVIQLVTDALGAPTSTSSDPFGDHFEWAGVGVDSRGWATVGFSTASSGGYDLRAEDGITVGSTRADVLALTPLDVAYDGDGDGKSDSLGLEPEPEPGTESLAHPGNVGTSYIEAFFAGDEVSRLVSPWGDWRDI